MLGGCWVGVGWVLGGGLGAFRRACGGVLAPILFSSGVGTQALQALK